MSITVTTDADYQTAVDTQTETFLNNHPKGEALRKLGVNMACWINERFVLITIQSLDGTATFDELKADFKDMLGKGIVENIIARPIPMPDVELG